MKNLFKSIICVTGIFSLAFSGLGLAAFVIPAAAAAASSSGGTHVIINEIKLGGSTNSAIPTEYITLFNPTGNAVTLDGWKIEYAKAGAAISCQNSGWGVTASQVTTLSGTLAPNQLSAPIARSLTDNKDGSIHLVDQNGIVQDLVGWGAAAPCSETAPGQIPANDKSLERYLDCAQSFPIDTDNNAADFAVNGSPNPAGLSGQYATSCQTTNPSAGNDNPSSPATPVTGTTPTCEGILITELLPNPAGTDTGHEYIELYNPTTKAISLNGCSLQTSANSKKFNFSNDSLQPNQYKAYYDSTTGLTLPNSSGGTAWLLSPTDELQAINYPANLADNVAWASVGGTWQKTYRLTPNAANVLESAEPCPTNEYRDSSTNRCRIIVSASTLVPCKPNQTRNPSTNRCKSILALNSTLTPCKPGQYRNPETNRCKSTTSSTSTLTPCKPGKVRNPATNRCKSATSSNSTLKPCAAGQVRNPATNRCRKDTNASLASIKDVSSSPSSNSSRVQWIIGISIILGALGYAIYEWRQDISRVIDSAKAKFPFVNQSRRQGPKKL